MNYEQMSDLEINQVVTGLMFDCEEWPLTQCGKYFYHCGVDGGSYFDRKVVDYCNNPSDAWPFIMKNKITLFSPDYNKGECDWRAEIYDPDEGIFDFTCRNPLRAAMIVFLMMRDEQCQKP